LRQNNRCSASRRARTASLHLGHALSAVLNHDRAKAAGGRFLLRIEDIDIARSTPEFEAGIVEDLAWLGLDWEKPARRQSEHLDLYRQALGKLIDRDLVYPAFLTRGAIKTAVGAFEAKGKAWPRDPDGAPLYPGEERRLSADARQRLLAGGKPHAWRLDMTKALAELKEPLTWQETGTGPNDETGVISADPAAWGDVVLSRSDAPSSYHLAVTIDDALQGRQSCGQGTRSVSRDCRASRVAKAARSAGAGLSSPPAGPRSGRAKTVEEQP
jgi:glutamyl-Q tRNA(Asp) synthetase